jgi:hypothetical protein
MLNLRILIIKHLTEHDMAKTFPLEIEGIKSMFRGSRMGEKFGVQT